MKATKVQEIKLKTGTGDKYLYVATVIDHGETCDGHVRKLTQGTMEECGKAIEEDKADYLKHVAKGYKKDVRANEVWIYPKDGENNFTDGRIYDVFAVVLPNGKEGK